MMPERETTDPIGEDESNSDRLGVFVSGACAVHCALVPILLVILPATGVLLGDERLEWGLLASAGLIASWSLVRGYRRHRSKYVLSLLIAGLVVLVGARTIEHLTNHVVLAAIVSVLGAGMLIYGHVQNLRLSRGWCNDCPAKA